MSKLCVTCDQEFSTPGVRCQKCRDKSMPKKRTTPSMLGKRLHVPIDPLLLTLIAPVKKGKG